MIKKAALSIFGGFGGWFLAGVACGAFSVAIGWAYLFGFSIFLLGLTAE